MSLQHDVSLLGDPVRVPAAGGHDPLGAAKPESKRDLKKVALIVGLSVLAWVSTYTGMLELIQANLGEVGLVEKVATGLAVAMLQIMIVWLLDQLFSPIHASVKAFYIVGYLFLSLISVGFAFGFYWKVLESRSASTNSAETSIGTVQSALRGAETRLDQLVSTLESLTAISTRKAEQEAANGNSCPGSKPGAGPRMAMRRGDAEKFSFASTFVKDRSAQVKGDIKTLDTDLQRILKDDKSIVDTKTGTRNEFLKGMGRKLEDTTTRYNALRTDPQLRQIRQDAAERAEKTTFPDSKGGTYACPDGQLQSALRGVVAAIDQLPTLEKPKIAATEGSEAVIEAFRRLTMTLFGAVQFKLPPTPEELREKQAKAVQSMESPAAAAAAQRAINMEAAGLGKRDYIPLGIAIFVDFCLLMVSFGRPANRFARTAMELKAAELGPQSAIVGINREVHEDRIIRRNFEMFQHVVIHFGNHYLAAVPLTAPRQTPDGRTLSPQEREELQVEAQRLVNLFASLETNSAVVDRGLPPILLLMGGARLVRSRLLRQESKFARAGAFRFYRFRNRAWPELINGTVMGTAKKYQAELADRRRQEAEIEKELRQIEAKERQAANAQRIAQNAQRIAEAELRMVEAQVRQREIEQRMREAVHLRGQHRPRPMAPQGFRVYPETERHAADRDAHAVRVHAGGVFATAAASAPLAGGFAPASHDAPGPHVSPFNAPLGDAANHNTVPRDRARPAQVGLHGQPSPPAGPYVETSHAGEPRALPANVVPMPDRNERIAVADQQPAASAPLSTPSATAVTAAISAALSTPVSPSANAVPEVLAAVATPAAKGRGTSVGVASTTGPTSQLAVDLGRSSPPADLGSLLRTVAVTQMRVAHDVAEAVHRIEADATSILPVDDRSSEPSEPAVVVPAAVQAVAAPFPHDDAQRGFLGRGLAHDPGLDDAGSIAARYAPAQRPR